MAETSKSDGDAGEESWEGEEAEEWEEEAWEGWEEKAEWEETPEEEEADGEDDDEDDDDDDDVKTSSSSKSDSSSSGSTKELKADTLMSATDTPSLGGTVSQHPDFVSTLGGGAKESAASLAGTAGLGHIASPLSVVPPRASIASSELGNATIPLPEVLLPSEKSTPRVAATPRTPGYARARGLTAFAGRRAFPGASGGTPLGPRGPVSFDNYERYKLAEDAVESPPPAPPSAVDLLQAALKMQGDPEVQNPIDAAATLRVIVHYLMAKGQTNLVNTIRKEAMMQNVPLCLTTDMKIQGRDYPGNVENTELYQRFDASLHYLPPLDPTWESYTPWPSSKEAYRKDVIMLAGGQCEGDYVPLTLLIDHLFLDNTHESDYPYQLPLQKNFTQTFFTTYWEFSDPETLLTHFGRFYLDIPEQFLTSERETAIRVRVLKILQCWIQHLMVDFTEQLLFKARSFCRVALTRAEESASSDVLREARQLQKAIHIAIEKGCPRVTVAESLQQEAECPEPLENLHDAAAVLTSVQGLNEVEVARQICMISHEAFARISIREFFNTAWQQGSDLWTLSGSLRNTVERVSAMGEWVASQILQLETPKARTAQLRAFLRVAYHCLTLNNIAMAQAIFSGVYHKFVRRLPDTVGVMTAEGYYSVLSATPTHNSPVSEVQMWHELDLVGDTFKHEHRRRIMSKVLASNDPCVPILAFYQKHLILCNEQGVSRKLHRSDGQTQVMVHWDKMLRMAEVCIPIITFQSRPYYFVPIPKIRKILEDLPGLLTEAEMKVLSYKHEPLHRNVPPTPVDPRMAINTRSGMTPAFAPHREVENLSLNVAADPRPSVWKRLTKSFSSFPAFKGGRREDSNTISISTAEPPWRH